jgi:hypothetical protein
VGAGEVLVMLQICSLYALAICGILENPNKAIINESGLYSIVLTSRKPEAKRFKKWGTAEVIPSIRRSRHRKSPVPGKLRRMRSSFTIEPAGYGRV